MRFSKTKTLWCWVFLISLLSLSLLIKGEEEEKKKKNPPKQEEEGEERRRERREALSFQTSEIVHTSNRFILEREEEKRGGGGGGGGGWKAILAKYCPRFGGDLTVFLPLPSLSSLSSSSSSSSSLSSLLPSSARISFAFGKQQNMISHWILLSQNRIHEKEREEEKEKEKEKEEEHVDFRRLSQLVILFQHDDSHILDIDYIPSYYYGNSTKEEWPNDFPQLKVIYQWQKVENSIDLKSGFLFLFISSLLVCWGFSGMIIFQFVFPDSVERFLSSFQKKSTTELPGSQ